jgi:putative restriction endonuclease
LESRVHRPRQAGISGSGREGADSIVVSGGYEDDQDYGNLIIYTGHGGNDPATGRQVADQTFSVGNRALAVSCDEGLPVRFIRGAGGDPKFSPPTGYRYDGLYSVQRYWHETGRSGFLVYRYELVSIEDPISASEVESQEDIDARPDRTAVTTQRIVRNTATAQRVKRLHNHTCQVCRLSLTTPTGPYAEAAHIRPLGRPHDGPDTAENILCLCPNDHVLFDSGAVHIGDDYGVRETSSGSVLSSLRLIPEHPVSRQHIAYHREHIAQG